MKSWLIPAIVLALLCFAAPARATCPVAFGVPVQPVAVAAAPYAAPVAVAVQQPLVNVNVGGRGFFGGFRGGFGFGRRGVSVRAGGFRGVRVRVR